MQLNGTVWPGRCPGIRLELANPSPGSRVEPGNYVVQGRAMDTRARQGSGIDRINFFLDSRDSRGRFIGTVPSLGPGFVIPTVPRSPRQLAQIVANFAPPATGSP